MCAAHVGRPAQSVDREDVGDEQIKQLFIPLKNSKSFEISQKDLKQRAPLLGASSDTSDSKKDVVDDTQRTDDEPSPLKKKVVKRGKVKAKAKKTSPGKATAKAKAKKQANKANLPSPVCHVSDTACFLEDAQNMLEFTLSTVETDKIDKELCSRAMSKMIEFGFEGTVEVIALGKGSANSSLRVKLKEQFFDEMFPQQVFTTWSKLREHISKIVRLYHQDHMAAPAQESTLDEKGENEENDADDADDDEVPDGLNEQDVKDMVEMEKASNVLDSVAQVLDKNPIDDLDTWLKIADIIQLSNMLKRAHQAFNSTSNLLWRTFSQESFLHKIAELENVEARAQHVATTVAKAVWDSMPAVCFLLCQKTVNAIPARLNDESEQEFAERFDRLVIRNFIW